MPMNAAGFSASVRSMTSRFTPNSVGRCLMTSTNPITLSFSLGCQALHSGGDHFWSCDAGETRIRKSLAQSVDQIRAEQIARGFPSHENEQWTRVVVIETGVVVRY